MTFAVPELASVVRAVLDRGIRRIPGVDRIEIDLLSRQIVVTGSDLHDDHLSAVMCDAGLEAILCRRAWG